MRRHLSVLQDINNVSFKPFPSTDSFFHCLIIFVAFPWNFSPFSKSSQLLYPVPRGGKWLSSALPCQTSANTFHGISSLRQKQWGNKFIFSSWCLLCFFCLRVSHLLTLDERLFPVPSPKLQTKWQCLSAAYPSCQTVEYTCSTNWRKNTDQKKKDLGSVTLAKNSYRLETKQNKINCVFLVRSWGDSSLYIASLFRSFLSQFSPPPASFSL